MHRKRALIDKNLRRLTRDVVRRKTDFSMSSELSALLDSKQPCIFRIVWCVVILCCFCTSVYQIADRVQYYLSRPIAVDVFSKRFSSVDQFNLKFCSEMSDYVVDMLRKAEKSDVNYAGPIIGLHTIYNDLNQSKFWTYNNNKSVVVQDVLYVTNNNSWVNASNLIPDIDVSVHGQCTLFHLGKYMKHQIRFNLMSPENITNEFKIFLNPQLDFQRLLLFPKGTAHYWQILFKTYKHLNTSTRKCVSQEDFSRCVRTCYFSTVNATAKCRLPVHEKDLDIKPCVEPKDVKNSITMSQAFLMQRDVVGDCNCSLLCNRIIFSVNTVNTWHSPSGTSAVMTAGNTLESLTEWYVYDGTNLVTDIAGNLALFLGLTILSVPNVIFNTFLYVKVRLLDPNKRKHPIVVKMITALYETKVKSMHCVTVKKKSNLGLKTLQYVIRAVCVCVSIFMIQHCVSYYFTHPTRLTVEVNSSNEVVVPTITICGESQSVHYAKTKFAKQNNISDICNVSLLDLYQWKPDYTIENLWKKTEIYPVNLLETVVKVNTHMKLREPYQNVLPTFEGNCLQFKSKKELYRGYFTTHGVALQTPGTKTCTTITYTVYNDDLESESYNILTRVDVPVNVEHTFDYKLATVSRLNLKSRPCVGKETFSACKQQCLKKFIADSKMCRLPFLKNESGLEDCKSTMSARESQILFEEMAIQVAVGMICPGCTQQCKENIIKSTIYTRDSFHDKVLVLYFKMTDNVVENIIEHESYTIISLLCDIGNILGIALGMSVLDILSFSQRSFQRIITQYRS